MNETSDNHLLVFRVPESISFNPVLRFPTSDFRKCDCVLFVERAGELRFVARLSG